MATGVPPDPGGSLGRENSSLEVLRGTLAVRTEELLLYSEVPKGFPGLRRCLSPRSLYALASCPTESPPPLTPLEFSAVRPFPASFLRLREPAVRAANRASCSGFGFGRAMGDQDRNAHSND